MSSSCQSAFWVKISAKTKNHGTLLWSRTCMLLFVKASVSWQVWPEAEGKFIVGWCVPWTKTLFSKKKLLYELIWEHCGYFRRPAKAGSLTILMWAFTAKAWRFKRKRENVLGFFPQIFSAIHYFYYVLCFVMKLWALWSFWNELKCQSDTGFILFLNDKITTFLAVRFWLPFVYLLHVWP